MKIDEEKERLIEYNTMTPEDQFSRLYRIIKVLRGPEGCSWDLKQTPRTMRKDLIEEAYELIDAIDRKDDPNLMEELGDLYLIVTMIAHMKAQEQSFKLEEVLRGICEKLIRRHPHVFGEIQTKDVNEIIQRWDYIKENLEGKKKTASLLDDVPGALPPLERAGKLQKKAAKVGFEWDNLNPVWEKLTEEIAETKAEIAAGDKDKIEQELGDILFTVVNIARMLKIDPAVALNRTNTKFVRRFRKVEEGLMEQGIDIKEADIQAMDALWDKAKTEEK